MYPDMMSIDVIPMRADTEKGKAVWMPVFDPEETSYYAGEDRWKWSDGQEPPRNPQYRDDLVMNVSDEDGQALVKALGYGVVPGGLHLGIHEFIETATNWLRGRIGASGDDGTEQAALKAVTVAREGKRRGASHIFIG